MSVTTARVSVSVQVQNKPAFSKEALEVAAMVAKSPALSGETRKSMLRLVALVDEHLSGADKEKALRMIAALVAIEEMMAQSKGSKPWSLKEAIKYMEEVRKQQNPEAYGDMRVRIEIEITALHMQIRGSESAVCLLV